MTVPRSALSGSSDLQLLSNDLVIPNSFKSSQGTISNALQQAFVQSVEAKVEARLAVLLEGIGDAFYALDSDWKFTYNNRAAQDYFGVQTQDMLGRVIWELFPDSEGTELRRRYEDVAASALPAAFETEAVGGKGRHLEVRVFHYNGGLG